MFHEHMHDLIISQRFLHYSCACLQVKGLIGGFIKRPQVENMTLLKDVTGYLMPGTLTLVVGMYTAL